MFVCLCLSSSAVIDRSKERTTRSVIGREAVHDSMPTERAVAALLTDPDELTLPRCL